MTKTQMTLEELVDRLKSHLEHKVCELQAMEQNIYNHQHEWDILNKEINSISYKSLTKEVNILESRINELSKDLTHPILKDVFNSLKGTGIEKHQQLLSEFINNYPEQTLQIYYLSESSTPFEQDKTEFTRYIKGKELDRLNTAHNCIDDVILTLEPNSIVAEYVYEPHNSVHASKTIVYTIEKH